MSCASESSKAAGNRSSIPVEYAEFDQSTSIDEKPKDPTPKNNNGGDITLGSEYYDEDGNIVIEGNDNPPKTYQSEVISIPESRKKKKKRLSRRDSNNYDLPDSSSDGENDDSKCKTNITSVTWPWKCLIVSNILSALAGAIVCIIIFMAASSFGKLHEVPDAHHPTDSTPSSVTKNANYTATINQGLSTLKPQTTTAVHSLPKGCKWDYLCPRNFRCNGLCTNIFASTNGKKLFRKAVTNHECCRKYSIYKGKPISQWGWQGAIVNSLDDSRSCGGSGSSEFQSYLDHYRAVCIDDWLYTSD